MFSFLRHSRAWAVALLVPALTLAAALAGLFGLAQEQLTDMLFTGQQPVTDIVIAEIDERSINAIGQWPWPRQIFSQLITKLSPAAVIGIDVNFKEPSRFGAADDLSLARAIQSSSAPIVITAEARPDGTFSHPIAVFRIEAKEGFPNLVLAKDGVSRNVRLSRGQSPSFALAIAQLYAATLNQTPALPATELTRIHFAGPDRTFAHLSAIDILNGKIPEQFIKGKAVIIGATAPDLQDFHLTPFGKISGAEIQANIISTILRGNYFTRATGWSYAAIFILSIAAIVITIRIESIWNIVAALAGLFALYNAAAFILFDRFVILDIFYPNVAFIGSAVVSVAVQYVTANREKRFIRETFSHYLAPQVIQELIKDPSKIKLGGQKAKLTILFSDIRGFTTLSEGMTPERLTKFLNRYLGRMTNLILEHNGLIDKYIGDAIMAFWGAPLPEQKHAIYAIAAAMRMISELQTFNKESGESGDPPINIGIGINSGGVTVGNMGSELRFDYTVMGDNVNLASRLEGLTKEYGVNILVSQATVDAVRRQDQRHEEKKIPAGIKRERHIMFRELDQVQVKGKTQGVKIYEVVPSFRQEVAKTLIPLFDQARELYYAGKWREAVTAFERVLVKFPDDGPSQTINRRCAEFTKNPPENWEGVYQLTHK